MNATQRLTSNGDDTYSTVSDGGGDTTVMRVVDAWSEEVNRGYTRPTPVIHVHGRTEHGEYKLVRVDGFRPYFFIADEPNRDRDAIQNDRRVVSVTEADKTGVAAGQTDIPLLKITVELPWHVRQLRDAFTDTWEADVPFVQRFFVDRGVKSWCRVPTHSDDVVDASRVVGVDVGNAPSTQLRVATWDIEVDVTTDEFPDFNAPTSPVTAVTLHDSYTDQYTAIVNRGDSDAWSSVDGSDVLRNREDVSVSIHDTEHDVYTRVADWMQQHRPDVLTGWNSNSFDVPYLVNRARHCNEQAINHVSPTCGVTEFDDDRFVNRNIDGVHLLDLLDAYKKSQYTNLKSYSLNDVAAAETSIEKLDVDEQHAYTHTPHRFIEYNVRDVAACVAINSEVNLL